MSFVSVLKKIGQVIVTGAAIGSEVMGFPFVASLLKGKAATVATTLTSDLNTIASLITTGEAMFPGSGTGAQKLAAVTPLVQNALAEWASSNLPGKKPKDQALFVKGASEMTQGMVDILNSYEG